MLIRYICLVRKAAFNLLSIHKLNPSWVWFRVLFQLPNLIALFSCFSFTLFWPLLTTTIGLIAEGLHLANQFFLNLLITIATLVSFQPCFVGSDLFGFQRSLYSFLSYLSLLTECHVFFYSHLLKSLELVPFLAAQLGHVCQRPSPHIAKDFLISHPPSSLKYLSWLSHLLLSSKLR